jgi:hypothetical protein
VACKKGETYYYFAICEKLAFLTLWCLITRNFCIKQHNNYCVSAVQQGEKREAMRKTGREMYKERNTDRRISRVGTRKYTTKQTKIKQGIHRKFKHITEIVESVKF